MAEKHRVRVAAFAILEREGKILLARRFQTGYADGYYQMPSGHIEAEELPSQAAIREAKEEVGIIISPENLEWVHTMYRINETDRSSDYIDFFFRVTRFEGEPAIMEPHKCDDLQWVSVDELPENTLNVIKETLARIQKGERFSEVRDTKL